MAFESAVNRRMNAHAGSTMKAMVKSHLGSVEHGTSSYEQPSTLSPAESQRNYKITSWLNQKNFMGRIFTRMNLPGDEQNPKAHVQREAEFWRQASMPWGSQFMHTPTDKQRENNVAHSSFVKQRQLTIPDTYGQWYAFMHALAAAFGNISTGK